MAKTKGARNLAHDAKRSELLARLTSALAQPGDTKPSLRALADAAGVSVATLRHYFVNREGLVQASLAELHRDGRAHMERTAVPGRNFEESIREALQYALAGLRQTPLGNFLAMGMVEGLLDPRLGPACVDHLLEPTLQSIAQRLRAHQAAGQMRPADARHAALILFAPLLLACQHQDQLGGATASPLDLEDLVEEQVRVFVRAYRE